MSQNVIDITNVTYSYFYFAYVLVNDKLWKLDNLRKGITWNGMVT